MLIKPYSPQMLGQVPGIQERTGRTLLSAGQAADNSIRSYNTPKVMLEMRGDGENTQRRSAPVLWGAPREAL